MNNMDIMWDYVNMDEREKKRRGKLTEIKKYIID